MTFSLTGALLRQGGESSAGLGEVEDERKKEETKNEEQRK